MRARRFIPSRFCIGRILGGLVFDLADRGRDFRFVRPDRHGAAWVDVLVELEGRAMRG